MRKFLVVFVIGCGFSNESPPAEPDAGRADGSLVDAPVDASDSGPVASCRCLSLGVDYENGVGIASRLDLPSLEVTPNLFPVSGDPVVRRDGDALFVVNRFGANNVTVVDPIRFSVLDQFSTGPGSNPYDVAVRGATAYVAAFNSGSLQVWQLGDTTLPPQEIDLSSYDPDGKPNIASVAFSGNDLIVVLGLLDDANFFTPRGPGKIVVIDPLSKTVKKSFDLQHSNPFGFLIRRGEDLLVSTVADFSGVDGCLERIGQGEGGPAADGCAVENSTLGGYVSAFVDAGERGLLLAVSPSWEQGKVVRFTEEGGPTSLSDEAHVATDVGYCAATHQVIYRDGQSGSLHVYDLDEGRRISPAAGVDIGLPPVPQNGIVCF